MEKDSAKHRGKITPPQDFRQWASFSTATPVLDTYLKVTVIALTTSLLMWLVAFLDVGGEWFLMWQSQIWNGQEEAFRMFAIVGVVLLVVVQREPTPD
ncbi:MAG: DUF2165 family protein [Candidatus Acidiferrales bacterium]